jgi:TRAP-type uncharacterized transport system substrate-binding protein
MDRLFQSGSPARWWTCLALACAAATLTACRQPDEIRLETNLTLATGRADGTYQIIGKQLRDVLHTRGVEITLKDTEGTFTNLRLLSEKKVHLALAQSDSLARELMKPDAVEARGWRTLLAIDESPVQIVAGPGFKGHTPSELRSHRIAIGPYPSGSYATAENVLAALDVGPHRFAQEHVSSSPTCRMR